MTTKEALHHMVDAIPEHELDAAAAALQPLVDPERRAASDNASDTKELYRVSASALLRDWDSDEDRIYDDDPA